MKRILVVLLFFSSLYIQGDCFQPVDGINLWRLTSQVGGCVNYYGESTFDLLDTILCSVGNVTSLVPADFGAPYVISAPGYYKVCDNITASTTLTIASNDVVLDLGNYYLDGVSIIVQSSHKNITIKNGLIRNVVQAITVNAQSQNITIKELAFDAAVDGASPYGIKIIGGAVGITLKDLSFFGAAPQVIVLEGSDGNIITQALVENVRCVSTNQGIAATIGSDATMHLTYCEATVLRNISVTDPYQGLDVIMLNTCDGVSLESIDITSDLGSTATARGVFVIDSNNVDHVDVSVFGAAFVLGFSLDTSSPFVIYDNFSYRGCSAVQTSGRGFFATNANNIVYESCEASMCVDNGMDVQGLSNGSYVDCVTNNNGGVGLKMNICLGCTITSHYASKNGMQGITLLGVEIYVISDATLLLNESNGLFIDFFSRNVKLSGCYFGVNRAEGFFAKRSFNVSIEGSSALDNTTVGFFFDTVDNVAISGCVAQGNGQDGFYINGVNNGNIPGNPQGTTGKSPVTIESCVAMSNASNGFHFTNTGGVLVRDSSATYNSACGFHFDSGTWNASAEACTALSNASVGFLTWDPVAAYQNRFRDCFAGSNGTNSLVNPLGGSDFAMGNTPGLQTTLPIASIYPSSVLGTPEAGLFGIVSPMFCVYG